MTSSDQREIAAQKPKAIAVCDLRPIVPSIRNDLIFSRSLMQKCLDENQLGAALAFAVTTSKLLPVAFSVGLANSDLLTADTLNDVTEKIVTVLAEYLSKFQDSTDIVDEIVLAIADELQRSV